MILVELSACINAAGDLETFYLGTSGFTTTPVDTPASVAFLPRLKEPGQLGVSAFASGKTSGTSELQTGELRLINIDGELDAWIDYDVRSVVIRSGEGGAYPGDFPIVFTGAAASLEATVGAITIKLKDKAHILDRPVLTTQYLGTNAGPVGLEGLPGDIKGKVKPRTLGSVLNATPRLVNASKLTYQVSDGAVASIPAVYDRGAALTPDVDHATSALLTAATVSAGVYETCLAEGLFRIGSAPTGQITANVVQGAAAADRTVGAILETLALAAGLTAAEINDADVLGLTVATPQVVGIYLDAATTFREAMDKVAASVGAWWAFDLSGVLCMGQLAAPSALSDAYVIEADVLAGFERRVSDGAGQPVWRVNIRHSRLCTVQATDVATSVTDARRAELAQEYRVESAEDADVKVQFAQARELTIDTLLTTAADAAAEAARRLAIHKVRRDLFDVPVPLGVFTDVGVSLMSPIDFTHSRFGLSGGKAFSILGFGLALARDRVILSLWG